MNLKHVGRVLNTNRKCLVVFREIYDEHGNVVDENNCLVVETESLPDAEHQQFMSIIESDHANASPEIYNILIRERHNSGNSLLEWLHATRRLRKFPTESIEMVPNNSMTIRLDKLNEIIKHQKTGMTDSEISDKLDFVAPETETSDYEVESDSPETPEQLLNQARSLESRARKLRKKAKSFENANS